jgi:hypothetical protein
MVPANPALKINLKQTLPLVLNVTQHPFSVNPKVVSLVRKIE